MMSKAMLQQRGEVIEKLKAAQEHLEHQVQMFNALIEESYEALREEIINYNKTAMEARTFVLRVANGWRMHCDALDGSVCEPDQMAVAHYAYEAWRELGNFAELPPDSPEPYQLACQSWVAIKEAPIG